MTEKNRVVLGLVVFVLTGTVSLPIEAADWRIGLEPEGATVVNDNGSFVPTAEMMFLGEPFRFRLTIYRAGSIRLPVWFSAASTNR